MINKPQLPLNGTWYCDLFEKEMNFGSSLRHINNNTHIHKQKYANVVKDYEIFEPETEEIDYIPDKVIKH